MSYVIGLILWKLFRYRSGICEKGGNINIITILSHFGKHSSFLKDSASINRVIVSAEERCKSEKNVRKIYGHTVNFALIL